jgi:hypothetical protein
VLGRTTRLVVGTGVVGTIFRLPRMMALTAATLNEQYSGPVRARLRVSRPDLAEEVGVPFPSSPLAHAAAYCEQLREYAAQFARQGMDWVPQIVEVTGIIDLNPEGVGRSLPAYRSVGTNIPCLFPARIICRRNLQHACRSGGVNLRP